MANFDRYRVKHVGIRNSPALESAKTAKFSAIYNFLEGGRAVSMAIELIIYPNKLQTARAPKVR